MNWLPLLAADFDAAFYAALLFLELTCAVLTWLEWRVRWPIPVLFGYSLGAK